VLNVTAEGGILWIEIDRPPANPVDGPTSRAMDAAFLRLRDDPALRVGIVTGAGGRFFCAGWDLRAVAAGTETEDAAHFGSGGFMGLTERFDLAKPVIAAVNGTAGGGGVELALCCDMVLAVPHAEFALPEVHRGFIAEAGGVLRATRRLPWAIAMEMLLTGRRFSADEMLRHGLVNRIVPAERLRDEARALALAVMRGAPWAIEATKAVAVATAHLPLPDAYARMRDGTLPAYRAMRASPDRPEGPRAFVEKRDPVWQDRAAQPPAPDKEQGE
jgi:crotonobetainyl-CoA hydratase